MNTYLETISQLIKDLNDAKFDADSFKDDYLHACETLNSIYQIVTKNTETGPKRGVLEDMQDVMDNYERQLDFFRYLWNEIPEMHSTLRSWYAMNRGLTAPFVD